MSASCQEMKKMILRSDFNRHILWNLCGIEESKIPQPKTIDDVDDQIQIKTATSTETFYITSYSPILHAIPAKSIALFVELVRAYLVGKFYSGKEEDEKATLQERQTKFIAAFKKSNRQSSADITPADLYLHKITGTVATFLTRHFYDHKDSVQAKVQILDFMDLFKHVSSGMFAAFGSNEFGNTPIIFEFERTQNASLTRVDFEKFFQQTLLTIATKFLGKDHNPLFCKVFENIQKTRDADFLKILDQYKTIGEFIDRSKFDNEFKKLIQKTQISPGALQQLILAHWKRSCAATPKMRAEKKSYSTLFPTRSIKTMLERAESIALLKSTPL